jgi:NurA-like 5'-3' nuclease
MNISDAQSNKINSTTLYSIDYSDVEYSYKLEEQAEEIISDQTNFDRSEDLGGILVYFKDDELVAFYDYEMQKGTVYD